MTRHRVDKTERQRAIFIAARMTLRETPYSQISINLIAQEAKMTRQMISEQFASVSLLYLEIFRRRFLTWVPKLTAAALDSDRGAFEAFLRESLTHQHALLALAPLYEPELLAAPSVETVQRISRELVVKRTQAGREIDRAFTKAHVGDGEALITASLQLLAYAYTARHANLPARAVAHDYYAKVADRHIAQAVRLLDAVRPAAPRKRVASTP